MSNIQQILASILNAIYGKDVRQAIHDGVEMAYNKADDAETSASAAAEAASGSQESAAASAEAAAASASSASNFADQAEQYKNEAFHTTPAGYEDFVSEVNSSLDYLINTGVKNLFNISKEFNSSSAGLSFTNNSDGTVTVSNGTTTGEALYPSAIGVENGVYADLKPSTKYKASFGVPLSTNYRIQVYYRPTSSSSWTWLATGESGDEFEFTTPSQIYYVWVRFRIAPSVTVSNLKLYPMVRLAESDDKTFQPYAQTNAALTNLTAVRDLSSQVTAVDDATTANIFLYKVGRLVFLWGYSTDTFTANVTENIFQLPNECKPKSNAAVRSICGIGTQAYLVPESVATTVIATDGLFKVQTSLSGTKTFWFNMCYVANA